MIKYLDYNASTPINEEVLDYMISVYKNIFGNADSRTHEHGNSAREIVEEARVNVAKLLGIEKTEVIFTSGATESSNILILGLLEWGLEVGKKKIVTTKIEHKATLEPIKVLEKQGFKVDYVALDASGRIDAGEAISKITDETMLVTVQHVNNETGIIQPIKEIGDYCRKRKIYFHVDAAQSFGKLVEELRDVEYDFLSATAHKVYGPQGIGLLVMRKINYIKPPVKPLLWGGGQENGMRSGTIPVALVAGLGKACEVALNSYEDRNNHCKQVKQKILTELNKSGLKFIINGEQEFCMSNTINVSFIGVDSEALLVAMKKHCSISNGSACTAKDYNHSYVLKAMGLSEEIVESAIRLSWGEGADVDVIKDLIKVVKQFA